MPVTVTGTWITLSDKAGPDTIGTFATIGTITQPQPVPASNPNRQDQPFPPLSGETGKAKSPGGDLGAKGYAVELAAARRGVGRQPRM